LGGPVVPRADDIMTFPEVGDGPSPAFSLMI
jgi:hypothetical protein